MKFSNNREFFQALYSESELERNKIKIDSGRKTLTARNYADIILKVNEAICVKLDNEYINYLYDYDKKIYTLNTKLITNCVNAIQHGSSESLSNNLIKSVVMTIESNINLPVQNLAPTYIRKFNNKWFNLKTKEEMKDVNYFSFNTINYDLKPLNEVNSKHVELIDKLYHDWSNSKEDTLLLIKQIAFAALEANGRKTYIIIKGPGGNGKSSYCDIISSAVGYNNVAPINLHEISKPTFLSQINNSSAFIHGDDLATNAKLSHEDISTFKLLADERLVSVPIKYEANAKFIAKGVKVQLTNTDIAIYENTPAVADRITIVDWTSKNYRNNKTESIDIQKLCQDEEFIEAFISYIIYTTDYFEEFSKIERNQSQLQDILNENDTIQQFIDHIESRNILSYSHLPLSFLFNYYKDWSYKENPTAKVMSAKKFNKEIIEKLEKYGFIIAQNSSNNLSINANHVKIKPIYLKKYEINSYLFYDHINDIESKFCNFSKAMTTSNTSRYLINPSNIVIQSQFDLIVNHILNNELKLEDFNENYRLFIDAMNYIANYKQDATVAMKLSKLMNETDLGLAIYNLSHYPIDQYKELIEKYLSI